MASMSATTPVTTVLRTNPPRGATPTDRLPPLPPTAGAAATARASRGGRSAAAAPPPVAADRSRTRAVTRRRAPCRRTVGSGTPPRGAESGRLSLGRTHHRLRVDPAATAPETRARGKGRPAVVARRRLSSAAQAEARASVVAAREARDTAAAAAGAAVDADARHLSGGPAQVGTVGAPMYGKRPTSAKRPSHAKRPRTGMLADHTDARRRAATDRALTALLQTRRAEPRGNGATAEATGAAHARRRAATARAFTARLQTTSAVPRGDDATAEYTAAAKAICAAAAAAGRARQAAVPRTARAGDAAGAGGSQHRRHAGPARRGLWRGGLGGVATAAAGLMMGAALAALARVGRADD